MIISYIAENGYSAQRGPCFYNVRKCWSSFFFLLPSFMIYRIGHASFFPLSNDTTGREEKGGRKSCHFEKLNRVECVVA